MTEQIIGGGRISEAAQSLPNTMTDEEREASEREAERREMAFRELFAGDPKVVLMSLLRRVTALEEALAGLGGPESHPTEARENFEARTKATIPDVVSELVRDGEAYGDAASRLAKEMAEIDNARILQVITDEQKAKYNRIQSAMRWFETRGAIEVV